MANLPECTEEHSGTLTACQICMCYDKKPNLLSPFTRRVCQYFSYEALNPCDTCTTAGDKSIVFTAIKPCQTCSQEQGNTTDGTPYGEATWTQKTGLNSSCQECRNVGDQEEYVDVCDPNTEYCLSGKCVPDCPEYCDPHKCQTCEYLDSNRTKMGCVNNCTDPRRICDGQGCVCRAVPWNDPYRESPGRVECPRASPSVDGDCNCFCGVKPEQCAEHEKFDADNCRCIRDITYYPSQAVMDGLLP